MEPVLIISAVQLLASGDRSAGINHLRFGKENQRIHLLQGAWTDVGDMYDDADNYRRKYSIMHLVVAPFEEMDRLTMMTKMLPMLAARFNFPICEAVVVEHEKDRSDPEAYGTHWHVLVAHFDPTSGRVRDWWQNRFKHELMARIMEHRLGHRLLCGFYHDKVLDTLREEAAATPGSDLAAVADALEAAWPRGSRPDGTTVTKAEIKMHEAVGRDMVTLRKICRAAWAASKDMDQFNAALADAKRGLYAQLAPDPPPNWAIYDAAGMVGTVAGMTKAKKIEVTQKLGNPEDDDWYRPYPEPDPALERGQDDRPVGENPEGYRGPDGPVPSLHQVADRTERHDDAEAGQLFEAALNVMPAASLDYSEAIAQRLTATLWQKAMEYFKQKAATARDYIERRSLLDVPPINDVLAMVRRRRDELLVKLRAAQERARKTFMSHRAAMIPMPAAKDAKIHNDRIEALGVIAAKRRREWEDAAHVVKDHDKRAALFENQHLKAVETYKAETVRKRINGANLHLRVAERCMALINDDRGANVMWIAPETLFDVGVEAELHAKPNARWKIAGPPPIDRDPDLSALPTPKRHS